MDHYLYGAFVKHKDCGNLFSTITKLLQDRNDHKCQCVTHNIFCKYYLFV